MWWALLNRHWLWLVLIVGLLLRLGYAFAQDTAVLYNNGGDSGWYLQNGYALVTNNTIPNGINIDLSRLPTAPLYLIFVGFWQAIFAPEFAIIAIRVLQCLMGAATCYFAYRIARDLTNQLSAGLLTAGLLAFSPVFIIENAQIATETLYIFFVAAGLSVYIRWLAGGEAQSRWMLPLVGLLFGLATLTRAVLLLFPIGLALHLLLIGRRTNLKPKAHQAAVLLLVYALVVSTWTFYNLFRWNRLVIGGEGFAAFLYIGATEWDGPSGVDERLGLNSGQAHKESLYTEATAQTIRADPAGYIRKRLNELANAYLQPHGTVYFPGESLKDMAANWLRSDRSPGGLVRLTQGDYFWPKLLIYSFHYTALGAGLIGMWLYRHRWQPALPLIGFVLYTTLIHLALLALPRYIFPTEFVWWIFAGAAFAHALRRDARLPEKQPVPLDTRSSESL